MTVALKVLVSFTLIALALWALGVGMDGLARQQERPCDPVSNVFCGPRP